ncbi:hypothetical protein CSB37_01535 [bacterium DOLZORAL124_38_8]|nr:MAG: hypothetical protein CSB37_01535 [bacterium DOLZORAL124_38_8]
MKKVLLPIAMTFGVSGVLAQKPLSSTLSQDNKEVPTEKVVTPPKNSFSVILESHETTLHNVISGSKKPEAIFVYERAFSDRISGQLTFVHSEHGEDLLFHRLIAKLSRRVSAQVAFITFLNPSGTNPIVTAKVSSNFPLSESDNLNASALCYKQIGSPDTSQSMNISYQKNLSDRYSVGAKVTEILQNGKHQTTVFELSATENLPQGWAIIGKVQANTNKEILPKVLGNITITKDISW